MPPEVLGLGSKLLRDVLAYMTVRYPKLSFTQDRADGNAAIPARYIDVFFFHDLISISGVHTGSQVHAISHAFALCGGLIEFPQEFSPSPAQFTPLHASGTRVTRATSGRGRLREEKISCAGRRRWNYAAL